MISGMVPTVVFGDFNIDPKRDELEYNKLLYAMTSKGFTQIVNRPTHMKGHLLDHIYVRDIQEFSWHLHHPYWTDHDATCLLF